MALIECSECKKEISDKSEQCVYCGFPLNNKHHYNTNCIINGTDYELGFLLENDSKIMAIKLLREVVGCGLKEAKDFVDLVYENKEIPKTYIMT